MERNWLNFVTGRFVIKKNRAEKVFYGGVRALDIYRI